MSSSVENPGDTLERFLAGSVPDLKFDNFILDRASEGAEFDTDSDLMLSLELVVLDSAHQTTLTDTSITNYNQLEKVILSSERLVLDDVEGHGLEVRNLILVHF